MWLSVLWWTVWWSLISCSYGPHHRKRALMMMWTETDQVSSCMSVPDKDLCYVPLLPHRSQWEGYPDECFSYLSTKTCATWEKGPYAICEQRRSSWACTSMQSDLGILYSLTYTTVSIDSVSGKWMPWSACMIAQAYQGLPCPQSAGGPFSCVAHYVLQILMSTHNICFCREIRKISVLFGWKKDLIRRYA